MFTVKLYTGDKVTKSYQVKSIRLTIMQLAYIRMWKQGDAYCFLMAEVEEPITTISSNYTVKI